MAYVVLVRGADGNGWYPVFDIDERGLARMTEYTTREQAEDDAPKSAHAFGFVVLEVEE